MALLAALLLSLHGVTAHESCCAKAAAAMGGAVEMVWIPDLTVQKPDGWDDEEDGVWERPLIQIEKPPERFLVAFWRELRDALEDACPWLLLGLLLSSLLRALSALRPWRFTGLLTVAPSLGGAAMGLVSPLCSCSALPVALSLSDKASTCVAFVVSAQAAGLDSLLFTIGVLGLRMALCRLLAAGLLGFAAGLAAGAAVPRSKGREVCHRGSILDDLTEVGPSLLLGFSLTSLISAAMPGGLAAWATPGLLGRSAVTAIALPLQFCEHAAVPLAVALQKTGASGGLAFALLASGPATNSGSLAVLWRLYGARVALPVLLSIWFTSILISYLADAVELQVVQVGHANESLPDSFVVLSKPAMALLSLAALCRAYQRPCACKEE